MSVAFKYPLPLLCDGQRPAPGNVLLLTLDEARFPGVVNPVKATVVTAVLDPQEAVAGCGCFVDGWCFTLESDGLPLVQGEPATVLTWECDVTAVRCQGCCEANAERIAALEAAVFGEG